MSTINEVRSVTYGDPAGSYLVIDCNITTYDPALGHDDTFDAMHVYRESDINGMSPMFGEWLEANPDFPIGDYVPPTIEEYRANAIAISRVDFRSRMLAIGIGSEQINAYLASITDPTHKELMAIFWEDAQAFERLDTFVVELGAHAGKTPEEIDPVWGIY